MICLSETKSLNTKALSGTGKPVVEDQGKIDLSTGRER